MGVRALGRNKMKVSSWMGWSSALCLSATSLMAQETNETEALKKQLKQVSDNFEKALLENRRLIDALSNRLETLQRQSNATNATNATPTSAAQVTPALTP